MQWVKRLTGLVAALFLVTALAWVCSALMQRADLAWYQGLVKPPLTPLNGVFTLLVLLMYLSCILTISHIVVKRQFVCLIPLVISGLLSIIFLQLFFGLHNLYAAAIAMVALFSVSFFTLLHYLKTDKTLFLTYLYTFLFNTFGLILSLCFAMRN